MKCKDYYWLYINGTTFIATVSKKWEKELKSGNIEWKAKFNNIGKICYENRFWEFNFKLLHRLTVTKKQLCIFGVNEENICLYCKEPDSILHTFVECHYTQAFYVKVVDWFNAKFNRGFYPTPLEILFGTWILQGTVRLNLLIVYYLQSTIYATRKCTIKLAILLNLC